MTDMISQVADLSLADKLTLIDSVVASIRKEGGMPGKKAKVSKADKAEKADKPKRKAALGTLAWTAYVKHCKTTMPESFEGLSKESEKLVIVKGIRAEDPEGYTAFTEAWKLEHAETASVSDASSVADESVAEEVVAAPAKVAKKVVPKAAAAAAAAPKAAAPAAAAPKAAEKPVVKAAKPAAKAEKPAAAVAKPATQKKPVKAVKVEEVPSMPQKEIDGVSYWHDPESNGLWEVTGPTVADGTGAWIGYFQPGDEAEPIRFTEAFGSD